MKLAFVLLSSLARPIPSTRVAVANMLPLLQAAGHDCHVVHAPDQASETPDLPADLLERLLALGPDLVVFQKVRGPSVLALLARLRAVGVPTCFMVCDLIDNQMVAAADGTVVVTEFLRSLHTPALQSRIQVVHDGIERPQVQAAADSANRRRLHAVLVTSAYLVHLPVIGLPPPWLQVTIVGPYRAKLRHRLQDFRWTLKRGLSPQQRMQAYGFLLHPGIRCVPWHADGVYDELRRADVGIIPIEGPAWDRTHPGLPPDWLRKSENRLTLKMAVGLPVVATPIPSYAGVIEQGENGFFAHTRREWLTHLDRLRDGVVRKRMGAAGRDSVLARFSMASQAHLLVSAFERISAAAAASAQTSDKAWHA